MCSHDLSDLRVICESCKTRVWLDETTRWLGHLFCSVGCKGEALEHHDADERNPE